MIISNFEFQLIWKFEIWCLLRNNLPIGRIIKKALKSAAKFLKKSEPNFTMIFNFGLQKLFSSTELNQKRMSTSLYNVLFFAISSSTTCNSLYLISILFLLHLQRHTQNDSYPHEKPNKINWKVCLWIRMW